MPLSTLAAMALMRRADELHDAVSRDTDLLERVRDMLAGHPIAKELRREASFNRILLYKLEQEMGDNPYSGDAT